MKISFFKKGALTLAMGILCVSAANAMVLDFEDLYPDHEGLGYIPTGYMGLNWSDDSFWITKNKNPNSGYDYGTIGNVSLFTGWANNISFSDNRLFSFTGAYITAAWRSTLDVLVEGYRDDVLVCSQEITTHNDKAYWFNFACYNVDEIWFYPGADNDGMNGDHIAIDNIYIDEARVPLESGQVTLDKTDEGNDAVVVRIEDMPNLAAVVKDADTPFDMIFRLETPDNDCIAYERTVTVHNDDISLNFLKYHEEFADAEIKVTCSLNNSRCKVGAYHTDVDETCASENMTMTLEIAGTRYSNKGLWNNHIENSTMELYRYTGPAAD